MIPTPMYLWVFVIYHPDRAFTMLADLVLLGIITANILITKRHMKELCTFRRAVERWNRDKIPQFISAMDRMASVICPLCGVASGECVMEMDHEPVEAESEIDGKHVVHKKSGVTLEVPCRAHEVRDGAREAFKEAMESAA